MTARRFFPNTIKGEVIPNEFISIWNTQNTSSGSSANNRVSLPLINIGQYDFIVDWGDGTSSNIVAWNQAAKTHTYAVPGIYEIKITGIITGWRFNNTLDRNKILQVLNWGPLDLVNIGNYFHGASNLNSLAENLKNTSITNFDFIFGYCGLTSIPAKIFKNCPNLYSIEEGFSTNQITVIPSGLFDNCPNAFNFSWVFYGNAITTIPAGMFDNNPATRFFTGIFGDNLITAIPSGLLDNCPNITTVEWLFEINRITAIPTGLFDNNPLIAIFMGVFFDNLITTIPSGLFDNNASATNFDWTFETNAITEIPIGLFDNCPNVTRFNGTFGDNNISSVPAGLFDNCPNVTSFEWLFYDNSITSVPATLFQNCPNVTSFDGCFYGNTINTTDYSALLVNLAQYNLKTNVKFHGGSSKYNSTGQTARNTLISRGWTITDGGLT